MDLMRTLIYDAGGRLQVSRNSRASGDLTRHLMRATAAINALELTKGARRRLAELGGPLNDEAGRILNAKLTPKRMRRRVAALGHKLNAHVNRAKAMSHELLWDGFSRATSVGLGYNARWDDPRYTGGPRGSVPDDFPF